MADRRGARRRPTPMCAMKSKTRHVPILGDVTEMCRRYLRVSRAEFIFRAYRYPWAAVCMLSPGMAFRGISMPRPREVCAGGVTGSDGDESAK